MNKLSVSLSEIYALENLARRKLWINELHPLPKLIVTITYIAALTGVAKYDLGGVLVMGVYLAIAFGLSGLSLAKALRRMRLVLPLVCCLGLANPLLDGNRIMLGAFSFSAGWLSLLTLACKGVFAVLASYQLIATTPIDKICAALRAVRVPQILVVQILLTYRYVVLLLKQANNISQAYSLRAPRQKGLHFKVWGSLLGQLLLRSFDRADALYGSMLLRGFRGEYYYAASAAKPRLREVAYLVAMAALILILRCLPAIKAVGASLTGGLP